MLSASTTCAEGTVSSMPQTEQESRPTEAALDALPPAEADGGGNGTRGREAESTLTETNQVPYIVKAACRFAAARRRPAVIYLLAEGNAAEGTPDTPITKRTVLQLASALHDESTFDALDLVIQSSGGDIHAAFQMMSLLRSRMTEHGELVACVPRKAQSSATLLCLGGDQILLGELGALGPLDAQIRVGLTDVGTPDYASALHLIKGLTRLQEFSLATFNQAAAMLYEKVSRNEDILKYGIEFSRGITAPLFERIESHKLGYWDQMLQTGETYGRRLLKRGNLIKDVPGIEKDKHIDKVIRQLVNDYPSHEYVIDCDELSSKLHLKADFLAGPERSAALELARSSSDTLIMVVHPPGADRPPAAGKARATTIRDWNSFGDGDVHDVSWDGGDLGTFTMRVGLYSRPISRNPWRENRATAGGSPSIQYFAGGDLPGW